MYYYEDQVICAELSSFYAHYKNHGFSSHEALDKAINDLHSMVNEAISWLKTKEGLE